MTFLKSDVMLIILVWLLYSCISQTNKGVRGLGDTNYSITLNTVTARIFNSSVDMVANVQMEGPLGHQINVNTKLIYIYIKSAAQSVSLANVPKRVLV